MFSPSSRRVVWLAAAALGVLLGVAPRAQALPSLAMLEDVSFGDGASASGFFDIDVYGFLYNQASITTTPGSTLGGTSYGLAGSSNDSTEVRFSAPGPLSLILDFALPLGSVQIDPIVGGCEYTGFSVSCGGASIRYVTSGFAVIPEPASLAVLTGGLVALGAARSRYGRRISGSTLNPVA